MHRVTRLHFNMRIQLTISAFKVAVRECRQNQILLLSLASQMYARQELPECAQKLHSGKIECHLEQSAPANAVAILTLDQLDDLTWINVTCHNALVNLIQRNNVNLFRICDDVLHFCSAEVDDGIFKH